MEVLKKLVRPHDVEIVHHHADEPSLAGFVCLFMSLRISKDETLQRVLVRGSLMLPAHERITRIPPASTSIRGVDRGALDDDPGIHTLLCVHTAGQALPASALHHRWTCLRVRARSMRTGGMQARERYRYRDTCELRRVRVSLSLRE